MRPDAPVFVIQEVPCLGNGRETGQRSQAGLGASEFRTALRLDQAYSVQEPPPCSIEGYGDGRAQAADAPALAANLYFLGVTGPFGQYEGLAATPTHELQRLVGIGRRAMVERNARLAPEQLAADASRLDPVLAYSIRTGNCAVVAGPETKKG